MRFLKTISIATLLLFASGNQLDAITTSVFQNNFLNETAIYTVSFNSAGGTYVSPVMVSDGSLIEEPDDPTLDAYYCDAWYKDADYEVQWDFSTDVVTENTTLYAHWSPEDFSNAEIEGSYLDDEGYYFQLPLNYNEEHNASRKYPVVIGLHGGGASAGDFYAPFLYNNLSQCQAHPAFLFSPTTFSGWESGAAWSRTELKELIETYRIDTNRIYVAGFSMGGSGSYPYVNLLYTEQELSTAAIFRSAGGSNAELTVSRLQNLTSIWYEVGSQDDQARVILAETSYQTIKAYEENSTATEIIISDIVGDYPRETKTLTKDGIEIMKKSTLTGMGHQPFLCYSDPEAIEWLFSQSLSKRRGDSPASTRVRSSLSIEDSVFYSAVTEIEVDFSQYITDFSASSFSLSNAKITQLDVITEGLSYKITVEALAEGYVSVELNENAVENSDGLGNYSSSVSYRYIIDNTRPEVEIIIPSEIVYEEIYMMEIQFSENVSLLDIEDIIITNGELKLLRKSSGTLYYLYVKAANSGDLISITIKPNVVSDDAGNYNTEATNSYTYLDPSSAEDIMADNSGLRIYPNPAFDIIFAESSELSDFTLMNIEGKILARELNSVSAAFSVSSLPEGLYFIRSASDKKLLLGKFMKR